MVDCSVCSILILRSYFIPDLFFLCFVVFLFILINLKKIIHLFIQTVPGLSCSTQDLRCCVWDLLVAACGLLSCGVWASQLQHADSQLRHACRIQFPDQGSNLGPLHWERGVLPTGPPGKSLCCLFLVLRLPWVDGLPPNPQILCCLILCSLNFFSLKLFLTIYSSVLYYYQSI